MSLSRVLTFVFGALLLAIQYPLWLGKGGWLRVWDLDRQVSAQARTNDDLKRRNGVLDAEVRDLKNGLEAVEERARFELGMIKDDEVFFQILEAPQRAQPESPARTPDAAARAPAADAAGAAAGRH